MLHCLTKGLKRCPKDKNTWSPNNSYGGMRIKSKADTQINILSFIQVPDVLPMYSKAIKKIQIYERLVMFSDFQCRNRQAFPRFQSFQPKETWNRGEYANIDSGHLEKRYLCLDQPAPKTFQRLFITMKSTHLVNITLLFLEGNWDLDCKSQTHTFHASLSLKVQLEIVRRVDSGWKNFFVASSL